MPLEIERRFLVTGDHWRPHVGWVVEISQGYLVRQDDGLTLRVRVQRQLHHEDQAWLTIKAKADPCLAAYARQEFEYPIPTDHGHALMKLSPWCLHKRRYGLLLPGGDWVLDVFEGENAPLVIAEVELENSEAPLILPPWCSKEITNLHALSNASLACHPLQRWDLNQQNDLWRIG